MTKISALAVIATAIGLSGCDMPDKLGKPDPAATWMSVGGLAPTAGEAMTLVVGRDGTFTVARRSGPAGDVGSVAGRWTVGEDWMEKSCWERVTASEFDKLAGRTGNSRVSRAGMSLRYWTAKGAELPNGAKVVGTRSRTLAGGAIDSGTGHPAASLPTATPPLPADAEGDLWLVEEVAELVRVGRAASASGGLLQWPIAVISECFGAPDANPAVHLRFRSRNLTPRASGT